MSSGRYENLTYGEVHVPCARGSCGRKGPKEVSKTRLASTDAEESKRTHAEDAATDTPVSVREKGAGRLWMGRGTWMAPHRNQEKRCRVGDLQLAPDAAKEEVKEHAQ